MKEYEVIIDFESKHIIVKAENKEDAEQKGYEKYEADIQNGKEPIVENYWVGDCYEVEEDDD